MPETMQLEVVTPSRKVLEVAVESVTLPGSEGELGILPEHIPLVTTLDTGVLSYSSKGETRALAVHWGYAQVEADRVSVLAELVENAHEIDVDRAQQAETRARETLSSLSVSGDNWEAEQQRLSKYEAKFKRALVRQQVSQFG